MKATLKSLRETKANPAVSIFVKTHREHPANEKDPIALKNQLKVAEDRLNKEYDKQTATTILEGIHAKIDELHESIITAKDKIKILSNRLSIYADKKKQNVIC